MSRLLLLGASLLAFHGHHQPRYWWPAMTQCTIAAKHKGNTFYVGSSSPNVYCVAHPAHWSSTPPPIEQPAG